MHFPSVAAITAALAVVAIAQNDGDSTPPGGYPSPWARGGDGWDEAYQKAQAFVKQLTLLEKVNLTTGVGWEGEQCVGNNGAIPRLNFAGKCPQANCLSIASLIHEQECAFKIRL